jgi:4-hydroxybutyrate dehydrogenase/sulfolactaldehyde 3-reductase
MNAEVLAQGLGLDLPHTLEVIHGSTATNGQLKINFHRKVLKDSMDPRCPVRILA